MASSIQCCAVAHKSLLEVSWIQYYATAYDFFTGYSDTVLCHGIDIFVEGKLDTVLRHGIEVFRRWAGYSAMRCSGKHATNTVFCVDRCLAIGMLGPGSGVVRS